MLDFTNSGVHEIDAYTFNTHFFRTHQCTYGGSVLRMLAHKVRENVTDGLRVMILVAIDAYAWDLRWGGQGDSLYDREY